MDYRQNVEQRINFRAVLGKLLIQWKPILIVAVVFALATTSVIYMRDMKDYKKSMQALPEISVDNSLLAEGDNLNMDGDNSELIQKNLLLLKEEEREDVERLIQMKESYWEIQQYMDQSTLMHLNPGNRHLYKMQYMISVPDEQIQYIRALTNGYSSSLENDLTEVFKTYIESEIEETNIRELIRISGETELMNSDTSARLNIVLTIPDGVDINGLQTAIDQMVTRQTTIMEESVCPHTIFLYWKGESYVADYDLLTRQTDVYSRYTNLKNNITTFENSLSSEQIEVYKSILNQITERDHEESGNIIKEVEQPPTYSKKWAGVGFVLGIIVYAVLYVLYICLRGCVRSREEIQVGWNLKVIGEVYHYSPKGFLRFVNSKIIYNLQHKGKTNLENQIDLMINTISSLSNYLGSNELILAPVGLAKDIEKHVVWNQVSETLKNQLTEKGVSVSERNLFLAADQIDEARLLGSKNVIPVVLSGVSKYQTLNELVTDAMTYDINLMGAIFVEG